MCNSPTPPHYFWPIEIATMEFSENDNKRDPPSWLVHLVRAFFQFSLDLSVCLWSENPAVCTTHKGNDFKTPMWPKKPVSQAKKSICWKCLLRCFNTCAHKIQLRYHLTLTVIKKKKRKSLAIINVTEWGCIGFQLNFTARSRPWKSHWSKSNHWIEPYKIASVHRDSHCQGPQIQLMASTLHTTTAKKLMASYTCRHLFFLETTLAVTPHRL